MVKVKRIVYDIFWVKLGVEIKVKCNEKGMSICEFVEYINKIQFCIFEIESGCMKEFDIYFKCLDVLGGKL